ncbi:serine/threonine-protein phosphatase, partial [PVC group bacterium]|nr:serine/threonine-protein phosphatase [PVC group bacterium]
YLFAGNTLPYKAVGGDFYDFIRFDKDHMGILLGDVSGKGFPAALHMARLMSDFRNISQTTSDPARVLSEVNKILCERARGQAMFTTALFILLDLKNDVVCASNAGHLPLMVCRGGNKIYEKAPASGPPLGILPYPAYEQTRFSLKPGDLVCLFSDGLLEAKDYRNQIFGLKRIKKILRNQDYKPKRLNAELQNQILDFSKNAPQSDDITLVSFKRR